jgi:hypothetical protein
MFLTVERKTYEWGGRDFRGHAGNVSKYAFCHRETNDWSRKLADLWDWVKRLRRKRRSTRNPDKVVKLMACKCQINECADVTGSWSVLLFATTLFYWCWDTTEDLYPSPFFLTYGREIWVHSIIMDKKKQEPVREYVYDMIWYDMIWYDMIYDMIWYDMIWYDMIWF